MTLTRRFTVSFQPDRSRHATAECVYSKWRCRSAFTVATSASSGASRRRGPPDAPRPLVRGRANRPAPVDTVGTPPGLPGREFPPRAPEDPHGALRHVLAAVVAAPPHARRDPRVPDAEALTRLAAEE